MKATLLKHWLIGISAAGGMFLAAPFVIKTALRSLHHFTLKPYLAAHDVNFVLPWAVGLTWAFIALALAAFLVAFDVSFTQSHKSRDPK